MKIPYFFRSFIVCAVIISLCGGWGVLVHKTDHQLAVYELPVKMQRFFYKNMQYITDSSIRPDIRRNKDSTEGPKHFIDLEKYGDSAAWKMPMAWNEAVAKYSKDTLLKYGYVPYHIINMKNKLINAFKSGNGDSILFYAIDLGHYIEDANVPLHSSVNYDGQLTGQRGIHALWESVVPEIEITGYDLYTRHKATYLKDPALAIWTAIRTAHGLLPGVLKKEKEVSAHFVDSTKYRTVLKYGKTLKYYTDAFAKAYGDALKPTINQQLISSANLVADFWYTAWVDGGSPNLDLLLKTSFTRDDEKKLNTELRSFEHNTLIKDSILKATKGNFRE